MNWDKIIHALVLVRMGQELGTDSRIARAVHALAEIIVGIFK
jgi:hypothetical protein